MARARSSSSNNSNRASEHLEQAQTVRWDEGPSRRLKDFVKKRIKNKSEFRKQIIACLFEYILDSWR